MTRRRTFLQFVSAGTLAAATRVRAQAPAGMKTIGVLVEAPRDTPLRPPQQSVDALRERGWIEGQNLAFLIRAAEGDRLAVVARELVEAKVDLILTFSTPSTKAAKAATTTIPILFIVGDDPVSTGLVASLSHPDGNLTGAAAGLFDDKMLDILKQAVPRASRVVFPVAEPSAVAKRAAQHLGVTIVRVPLRNSAGVDVFLQAVSNARPDGVVVPNVAWMNMITDRFAEGFRSARIPAIAWPLEFTHAGGLLSYSAATDEGLMKRRSDSVNALLRGANPRDIPVELFSRFRLGVNLVTAKVLAITIPATLLLQAFPEDVVRS